MKSTGLFAELKNHPWILALVIVFHLCLAILLGMNLSNDNKPTMPAAKQHEIISAVVVDAKQIDVPKKIKKQEVKKAEIKKKKIEKQKDDEKKKIAIKEEERKKKALEKKELEKKVLEKKIQEQKKLEKQQLEKKKQLELKKKKEQERIQKEKAEKEKAAKEKAEKERIIKEKARKKAEEQKRKQKEELERRAAEKEEFKNALLEEERAEEAAAYAAKLQTLRQKYVFLIAQKVQNNWLRPVANTEGQSCDVIVTQTMTGEVLDVQLKSCTSDNAFQRSVERAVRKASPLPMPPNPDVFDREIYFTFKPH